MKKFCLFASVAASVSVLFASPASAWTLYPRAGYVSSVDRVADIVSIDDGADVWTISGVDSWTLGDGVALLMDDNGTPENIYDDAVVSARYTDLRISR